MVEKLAKKSQKVKRKNKKRSNKAFNWLKTPPKAINHSKQHFPYQKQPKNTQKHLKNAEKLKNR
jgi:hypothetical protein